MILTIKFAKKSVIKKCKVEVTCKFNSFKSLRVLQRLSGSNLTDNIFLHKTNNLKVPYRIEVNNENIKKGILDYLENNYQGLKFKLC